MVKTSGPRPVKAKISFPTRIVGTVYQNLTGRPLMVIIAGRYFRDTAIGACAYFSGLIDTVTPPMDIVAQEGLYDADNKMDRTHGTMTFMVPPGYYYQVVETKLGGVSGATLVEWTEVEL